MGLQRPGEERQPPAGDRGRLHPGFQARVAAGWAQAQERSRAGPRGPWSLRPVARPGQAPVSGAAASVLREPASHPTCLLPLLACLKPQPPDGHSLAPPLQGGFLPEGSEGLTGSHAPTPEPESLKRQWVTGALTRALRGRLGG